MSGIKIINVTNLYSDRQITRLKYLEKALIYPVTTE